jgi:hypothetical protein
MSAVSFPGSGQGEERPLPGSPAWDEAGQESGAQEEWLPGETVWVVPPDDDWDADAYLKRVVAEADAGLIEIPPESGQMGITVGGYVDPEAYAACGGLAGIGPEWFAQGGPADGMAPGLLLTALVEQAVTGEPAFAAAASGTAGRDSTAGRSGAGAAASAAAGEEPLAGIPGVPGAAGVRTLSDDELLGVVSAARRMANRAEWLELAAEAEFTRRRYAETEMAVDRGDGPGQRAGEFAAEELAMETVSSARKADERMGLSNALASRLPRMMARIGEGAISSYQALVVHRATCELSGEDARLADAILAAEAPSLTPEQLGKRARQVAMTLDPEAAERRRKKAKKQARLETWQEESGNAALAGREMDPRDVLAANAYYDAVAEALHRAGVPGTRRELRMLAYTDRNTGRDPLDRIPGHAEPDPAGTDPAGADSAGADSARDARRDERDFFPESGDGYRDGGRAPDSIEDPRAGAGSGEPGKAWMEEAPHGDGYQDGLRDDGYRDDEALDNEARDGEESQEDQADSDGEKGSGGQTPFPLNINLFVTAGTLGGWSSVPGEVSGIGLLDPQATRDLVRSASNHPKTRWCVTVVDDRDGTAVAHGCAAGRHPWNPPGQGNDPGTTEKARQVSDLLDRLGVKLEPIARGSCDHRHREERYTPSRKLKHLIRARTARCPAPGCGAQAVHCDQDHTIPYPLGKTCECNLSPPCRRHHRVKQAPGWRLEQPEPGVMRWHAPSGRAYGTEPTVYPA